MDSLSSILLGIVQGLTEFLPVSSSGHLVLFQNLLGFHEPELLLDTSLHIGTLAAVLLYFRGDVAAMLGELRDMAAPRKGDAPNRSLAERIRGSMVVWVLVGNIPTALIGLGFRAPLERMFGSVSLVGAMLLVTGLLLAITRLVPAGDRRLGLAAALAVGAAQGLAIIPGISRSGATIACGLLLGLDRDLAARFSFLLSIPAIVGALIIQVAAERATGPGVFVLLAGGGTAALVGLFALRLLMGMVRGGRISWFAPYCGAAGLAVILTARFF